VERGGTRSQEIQVKVILETRDLNRSFGAVSAARDINVIVTEGETVGIIGANGAGKTTFVNIVTGYVKPTSGTVHFDAREITQLSPRQIVQAGLARSFQVPQLFASATVFDNLLIAVGIAQSKQRAFWRLLHEPERIAQCERMLERFQIAEYRDQSVSTLPQGVRKLLDIAMAMVRDPKLMLLDEPTSGITSEEKFPLMDIVVGALQRQGLTVLFIEHDMDVISRYAERVMAFYDGEILADGPTAQVLADPAVRERVIGEGVISSASALGNADGMSDAAH
jgi:branched-chain amino acid transport system ATP-binding protein